MALNTLQNVLYLDGVGAFLFGHAKEEVQGFFIRSLDQSIESLRSQGNLVDAITTAIALMDCLINYLAEKADLIVKGMLRAGLATRMEALFKLCCKFAPRSDDLQTFGKHRVTMLLDRVIHSLKVITQTPDVTLNCLPSLVSITSMFIESEAHFNAILYQQYENHGSESTDSNDEMVFERQSEAEVIREAFLLVISAIFKTLH